MIGGGIGAYGIGGRAPINDIREATLSITASFTNSFDPKPIFDPGLAITAGFTNTFAGSAPSQESRMITDTVTYLQKPVNVVMAEQALRDPQGRLKEPGAMSRSLLRKIMRE